MVPVIFITSVIIFFMMGLIPGDAVDAMLSVPGAVESGMDRAMIEQNLGLDASSIVLYGRWLGVVSQVDGTFSGILQGSLGISWWRDMEVLDLMAQRWPVTLELGLIGIVFSLVLAIPIGVYSAVRQDRAGDYIGRSVAILCISVPDFWLATLVIIYPAIWFGYMPPIMLIPFSEDPIGNLQMFIVPGMILGMSMSGLIMRMVRTMMLEVLRQDYVRTAWAKGLRERVVIMRHALRNALIPVVTIIGIQLPVLIGGTVIIEQIFSLPGMGRLTIEAVFNRDLPLINGIMFVFAAVLLVINFLIDITYAYLNPKVRYE